MRYKITIEMEGDWDNVGQMLRNIECNLGDLMEDVHDRRGDDDTILTSFRAHVHNNGYDSIMDIVPQD